MPIDVQHNIIEGTRLREQDGVVIEYVDLHLVHGFDFSEDWAQAQPERPLVVALQHVPQPGDQHSVYSDLVVRERSPRPEGFNLVMVEVVYRFPDATSPGFEVGTPELSGGASLEQIETAAIGGTPLVVGAPNKPNQGGVAPVYIPIEELNLTFSFLSNNPWQNVRPWIGAVNIGPWGFDPTAQPRTWIVSAVPYKLINQQFTPPLYNFTYQLRHRFDGWDPIIYYIDPETGQPPPDLMVEPGPYDPDADPPPGLRRVPWYPEMNFNLLA